MIWHAPDALWLFSLLLVIPALAWYLNRRLKKKASKYFSDDLLAKLRNKPWRRANKLKNAFFYMALFFLIAGLAGPKIGSEIREVKRQGVDLVIALDVSRSMLAEDIRPNRLDKAKLEILSLVDRLAGDRVGLILFTNTAFIQSPLTSDISAFKMYLDIASTEQLPFPGTDFNSFLNVAKEMFEGAEEQRSDAARVLLVFSDGEDHSPGFDQSLRELVNLDVFVYTVGIGTTQGTTIPIYDSRTGRLTDYHRDRSGSIVTTRLEPDNLRRMAQVGRGVYYEIQRSNDRIDGFVSKLDELERRTFASDIFSDYKNRYQYPTAIGLLFLIISFMIPSHKPAQIFND